MLDLQCGLEMLSGSKVQVWNLNFWAMFQIGVYCKCVCSVFGFHRIPKNYSSKLHDMKIVLPSFSGHFLLLRYPPPTKGWEMGTVSLDLYQAVPASLAHSSSFSYKPPDFLVCVPYNISCKIKIIYILQIISIILLLAAKAA